MLLNWLTAELAIGTALLVVILHVVFWTVGVIQKRRQQAEALRAFPGPPQHWIWGNLNDLCDMSQTLRQQVGHLIDYGSVIQLRVNLWKCAVKVADPESVREILNTSELKEPLIYDSIKPWIGEGLIVSNGKKWARNRRLLTPAFHFDLLKPYNAIFVSSTQIMIEKWKKMLLSSARVEMFESVSLMALDSLLKCVFSYPSSCQTEGKNAYITAVYEIAGLFIKKMLSVLPHDSILHYFTRTGYLFRKACHTVHTYSSKIIQARKRTIGEASKKKYLDFLDILLAAKDEDGNGLTDEEIQHEVDTFMFAGHDTTASGLSWFFYNMAIHPEHQQQCYEEIMNVLPHDDVLVREIPKMEYLTMCLKESLRINPPVDIISRMTTKPITFAKGLTAPEGIWIQIAIYGLHHNPAVWNDPEKFDPTRFTLENSRKRSPHAYIPFSAGPRNCIGQNFAMNEMKICAALVLKYFELSFKEAEEPIPSPEIVVRAKNGIWLTLKARNSRH